MPQKSESNKPKEAKSKSLPSGRTPELRLWTTHGVKDVYLQREAVVNLWTVLGGLAMAALLTQLSPLLHELQESHWYLLLFFIASILTIANSWVQTSWGSIVLKSPISILFTIIMLFQMLSQAIRCLLVTNPSGWLAATAGIIFCSMFAQLYFARSGAWKVFDPGSIKRIKFMNTIYLFLNDNFPGRCFPTLSVSVQNCQYSLGIYRPTLIDFGALS